MRDQEDAAAGLPPAEVVTLSVENQTVDRLYFVEIKSFHFTFCASVQKRVELRHESLPFDVISVTSNILL